MPESDPVPFGIYKFEDDPRWQEFLSRADMSTTSLVQAKARYYQQEVNPNFVPSGMLSPQGLQTDEPVHLSTAGNIPSSPVRLPPAAVPVPHHTAPSTAVPAVAVGATMTGRPVDRTPAGGIADAPLGSSCQGVASTATGRTGVNGAPPRATAASSSAASRPQSYMQPLTAYVIKPAVALSHGLLVLLFMTYLLTMLTYPRFSVFVYRNFLLLAACNHLGKVSQNFGMPAVMPYRGFQPTLDAVKTWLIPVAATTDLQYAIVCISLLGTRPLLPAIIPMAVLALFHSSYQLNAKLGSNSLWRQYGLPFHNQLFANLAYAQQANAGAEIVTGFLLLLLLLTPSRNILQTFLYWQILRVRYWSPDCMACHRQAWGTLAQMTQPVFDSAPFLKTPVGYIRQWFLNAGQQVQSGR